MMYCMIDQTEFRKALSHFATGVTIVSITDGSEVQAMTVSSFSSVSLRPPLVGFYVGKGFFGHDRFVNAERYGISVLRADQQHISNHFGGRRQPDLEDAELFVPENGASIVRSALAWLVVRRYATHEAGDHTLVLAEVEKTGTDPEGEPLLYFRSAYRP